MISKVPSILMFQISSMPEKKQEKKQLHVWLNIGLFIPFSVI